MTLTGVRRRLAVAIAALALTALAGTAAAQDLEPRLYTNVPVGMNFLIAGYGYLHGGVTADVAVPVEDANLTTHGAFLAYSRAIDVWGRSRSAT